MVTDDREQAKCPAAFLRAQERARGSVIAFVVLTLAVLFGAACLPFLLVSQGQEPPASGTGAAEQNQQFRAGERLFRDWPKPNVALMISGQMVGYLQPCGCSEPQYGGLARRYNFLQSLRDRGWNVVSADVGDVPQASGPEAVMKYKVAMNALNKMDYTAVSFGKNEMGLGLLSTLGEFALNEKKPRIVAANLQGRETTFKDIVYSGAISQGAGPKIGIIGIVGFVPEIEDADVKLDADVNAAVAQAVKDFNGIKPDLLVLLFQGKLDQAKLIAQSRKLPRFDLIVIPIESEDPSAAPEMVGKTMIVSAGQRGRHVVVVGAFRTASKEHPFELRFQLVLIGPEFETPKGLDATNPIHALLQEYAQRVKNNNLLAEFTKNPSKHPVQLQLPGSKYVGSDKCKQCHESAYDIWSKSAHFHAYDTLVNKATRPTLRQFDGECVQCHVTGFTYETGFVNEKESPKLKMVGCEACHGPASKHVANPNNAAIHAIINPWKNNPLVKKLQGPQAEEKKMTKIGDSCQKCHDIDNSVHFKIDPYWKMVAHPTPP